jgi:hypothetical protein
MTPRQIMANLLVAGRRKRIEQGHALSLMAIASQSEPKFIQQTVNSMLGER